jgi:hypothetical protein
VGDLYLEGLRALGLGHDTVGQAPDRLPTLDDGHDCAKALIRSLLRSEPPGPITLHREGPDTGTIHREIDVASSSEFIIS